FLNISYLNGWDLRADNDVRAWLLLEHLRLWRDWAGDPSSPMHGLADLDRIALIGHSRCGEAVATAAAFDRMQLLPENAAVVLDAGFGIDAVVAIAPSTGCTRRQAVPPASRTPATCSCTAGSTATSSGPPGCPSTSGCPPAG